jgi:hypothetical protein
MHVQSIRGSPATHVYLLKTWLTLVFCRKMGSGGLPGARLRRGYASPPAPEKAPDIDLKAEEAEEYAGTTPVNHLLLAIHGIGQNLSGSNIAGVL